MIGIIEIIVAFLMGYGVAYTIGYEKATEEWMARVDRLNEQLKKEGLVVKKEIR